MAAQVTSVLSKRDELDTLTLDHILSDLESLPPDHALLNTAHNTLARASGSQDSAKFLQSFEQGTFGGSSGIGTATLRRKDYVELSQQLLASFRNAQRLNSEQVSASEVGLLLPSERSRSGPSSTSLGSVGRNDAAGTSSKAKSTRTDLLHAKVADLQTQVDAWDTALQYAVKLADDPSRSMQRSISEEQGTERKGIIAADSSPERIAVPNPADHESAESAAVLPPSGLSHFANEHDMEDRPSQPATLSSADLTSSSAEHAESSLPIGDDNAAAQDFEDDDPWNDLT